MPPRRRHARAAGASSIAATGCNENPSVAALALDDGTPLPSLESDPGRRDRRGRPARRSTLRASWPDCPAGADAACAGAESYVWFDPVARAFVTRRESMRRVVVRHRGAFATARTGRSEAEAELATESANVWTAPPTAADVWLWVVLRDARGGVAWSSHHLRVD